MKNHFYAKLAVIFVLIIGLLVPQSFLSGLITERLNWREQAYASIGQSWPGDQTLAGPVLQIPYQLVYNVKDKVVDSKLGTKQIIKEIKVEDSFYLLPKQTQIDNKLESSLRYRGIYGVPIYTNHVQVKGTFNLQPLLAFNQDNKDKKIIWGKPQLSVLVQDQRGIVSPPTLSWDKTELSFQPGSRLPGTVAGMFVPLPTIDLKTTNIPFAFALELRGMRSLHFALLSDDTAINLASNWLSPSFTGHLLPDQRTVTAKGFSAQWRASSFSYNVGSALETCHKGACALMNQTVGVALIQPVDIYQQSERSIKYAFLFINLTFGVLVLLELLKKLRIHPIQYSLVGMALLVFYLLLISLSEHIAFVQAYGIGACASTVLLTLYFGAILHSQKLGLLLGAGLSTLYAVLYILLQAEEAALLMGSVLVFLMLALLMLGTRHLDWYALTGQTAVSADKA
jgi:inner membrane protein